MILSLHKQPFVA